MPKTRKTLNPKETYGSLGTSPEELIAYASREELAEGLHAALLHGGRGFKV